MDWLIRLAGQKINMSMAVGYLYVDGEHIDLSKFGKVEGELGHSIRLLVNPDFNAIKKQFPDKSSAWIRIVKEFAKNNIGALEEVRAETELPDEAQGPDVTAISPLNPVEQLQGTSGDKQIGDSGFGNAGINPGFDGGTDKNVGGI